MGLTGPLFGTPSGRVLPEMAFRRKGTGAEASKRGPERVEKGSPRAGFGVPGPGVPGRVLPAHHLFELTFVAG